MAGSQTFAQRGGRFAAALAIAFVVCAGRAPAQTASPPVPPGGMPAGPAAEIVDSVTAPDAAPAPAPTPVSGYTYFPGAGCPPTAPRVVMGPCDTAVESIFGTPDPDTWRSLPIWTFFTEGWNEAWVPSPNGSGGAPRQGWIDAMDGNLYRLWFFSFSTGFNRGSGRDAFLGGFTIFTPLSRRLDLITNIPFIVRNRPFSGLPTVGTNSKGGAPDQNHSGFGDISFTPRVLLHETQDFSLTADLTVTAPTGTRPLAGNSSLTPTIGFWNNFAGGWVIRGGVGDLIPLHRGSGDHLISQLAIGQTLTGHDVRFFGDFTYYLSSVVNTPVTDGDKTSVVLTPGMRTHLGNDWYFLAGLPVPVTKERTADLGIIFWIMKAW
jgi:hypothetical protein